MCSCNHSEWEENCLLKDEPYKIGMTTQPLQGKPSNPLFVIIEAGAKHTVTILVMHLFLIRVLECFAVPTVSIQTTHTQRTNAHTVVQTHTCVHINIQPDEYSTVMIHLYFIIRKSVITHRTAIIVD